MKKAMLVAGLVLLTLPGVAQGKGITAATLCGAAGCRTIDRPPEDFGSGGDGFAEAAPPAAPYYTVRLTAEEGPSSERWTIFYIPGAELLAFRGQHGEAIFDRPYGNVAALYREYTRGLEPWPAPAIASATVDGKPVADPQSYLSLYRVTGDVDAYPAGAEFVPIVLHSARPSPWTGARYLMVAPSAGVLETGGKLVQLPDDLADAIAARASLDPRRAATADGGFDWPLVSISLAVATALALAALLATRRGRRAATI